MSDFSTTLAPEETVITLQWATRTDVGLRRRANEDALVAGPPIFAVADGMGGHAAGDVASAIAVESVGRLVGDAPLTRREVLEAIREADADICRQADGDSAGMGTTITGLAVTTSDVGADAIVVFNVGDSRSYLLRGGALIQISHDHSVVQELIDNGTITTDEARAHPERNVITRSLGSGQPLDIDWWVLTPQAGDRFLLCSDGLFKQADDAELARLVSEEHDLEGAATGLLDTALRAGGIDNITLIVVDVIDVEVPPTESSINGATQPVEADDDDTNPNLKIGTVEVTVASTEIAPGSLSHPPPSSFSPRSRVGRL